MDDHETHRITALLQSAVLAGPGSSFQPICRLARQIFNVPMASVSFVGAELVTHLAREGFADLTTPRGACPCGHVVGRAGVTLLSDVTSAGWVPQNARELRFFAGAPITLDREERIGAVCLYDTLPREFTPADREALSLLASIASTEVRLIARS